MKVCLNSEDVQIKHVRSTYDDRVTGLVDESGGRWSEGYNYRLRDGHGEEFLAVLVEAEDKGDKMRLTFEK